MTNYNINFFFKYYLKLKLILNNFFYFNINLILILKYFIFLKLQFFNFIYLKYFFFNYKKLKKNKFLQKGKKVLGIYLKNFNKKKSYNTINNFSFFSWIIIVKRKNLFLTFLNLNGDVLFKSNLGSSGFKKRVKFTGYAIKETCIGFSLKIQKFMQNYKKQFNLNFKSMLFLKNKINLKKVNKRIRLFVLKKKNNLYKSVIYYKTLKKQKYFIYKNINILKKLKENINYKLILRYILKNKNYMYIKKYRNYDFYKYRNWFRNKKILMKIELRSEILHWTFRFIFEGLKSFFKNIDCVNYLENCQRISHSKGLRIKKKRRI